MATATQRGHFDANRGTFAVPTRSRLHRPFGPSLSALEPVFDGGPHSMDVSRRGCPKLNLVMELEALA